MSIRSLAPFEPRVGVTDDQGGSSVAAQQLTLRPGSWLRTFAGGGFAPQAVGADVAGDIYLAGTGYAAEGGYGGEMVMKLNPAGDGQWVMGHWDAAYLENPVTSQLAAFPNGDMLLATTRGELTNLGGSWTTFYDVVLVRFTAGGNVRWRKILSVDDFDTPHAVQIDSAGAVCLLLKTGHLDTTAPGMVRRLDFLVQLSGAGAVEWFRQLPPEIDPGVAAKYAMRDLALDQQDQLYLLLGVKRPTSTGYTAALAAVTAEGEAAWARALSLSDPAALVMLADGTAVVAGESLSHAEACACDAAGQVLWAWRSPQLQLVGPTSLCRLGAGFALFGSRGGPQLLACTNSGGLQWGVGAVRPQYTPAALVSAADRLYCAIAGQDASVTWAPAQAELTPFDVEVAPEMGFALQAGSGWTLSESESGWLALDAALISDSSPDQSILLHANPQGSGYAIP